MFLWLVEVDLNMKAPNGFIEINTGDGLRGK